MQTGDSSEGLYARLTLCLYIASCGLCGASAASSNCTEQNEALLGRSDSLSGGSHTASREQGGGLASDPNEPVEITTSSGAEASRVNRSDVSSMDKQDVAAAPTLAVTGPQPDPKDIPLALPVSQSGSNNAAIDDESPTSALFLQLEPAHHHTRQKQPSAQQASPKAEHAPVSTLHSAGSEVGSAQQLSTAAEQKLADADSAQPMTDDQLPTNLPAVATEQGHVDSEPVQNAANEDSIDHQADFDEGPVTDEQGDDTAPTGAHVGQAPSNVEEQHGTEQPGDADLATTKQTPQVHATSGTVHVSAPDDIPMSFSDTATHQPESSNKAHSDSKPDSVSAEDGSSTGASSTAVLPDEHMATSPSFHGPAPAGRDDTQHEDKQESLESKQSAMQGTQSVGSKQISSHINTHVAAANADYIRETSSADQDDTNGDGGAGLPMNGQGNGHQPKAEPITEGDSGKSAQSRKLHVEDDSLADDTVVRPKAGADIAGVSVQAEAVTGNQRDDTTTVDSKDAGKSADAGAGQNKKKSRGTKKKKKNKS